MYLYFNKEGILETVIPHGETVRQGSYLNIYVLLDDDFFIDRGDDIGNYSVNVELAFPNNRVGTVKTQPVDEPALVPFQQLDDSEITYALVDGKEYWTYHFRFTPNQATLYAGKIFAMVSVMQTELSDPDNIESAYETDLLYYGKADIYVEKVFGIAKRMVDEAELHYKNLVVQLNELNKRKVNRLSLTISGNDEIASIIYQLIYTGYVGLYVINDKYTAYCYKDINGNHSVQLQTLNANEKIMIYSCTVNTVNAVNEITQENLTYNSTTLREINVSYNDNGVMLINGEEVIKDTAILDDAIKIKLDEHDNNISNLQTDLVTAKSDISTLKTDVEVLKQSGGSGGGSSGGSGSTDTTELELKVNNLENSVSDLSTTQGSLLANINTNKTNISTITTILVNKADKSDLTLINAELINKASKTDLNNAVANINLDKVTNEQLNKTLVDYVSNSNLSEELEKKVDTSVFNNFSTSTSNSLSGKLSVSEFNTYKNTNTENLSKLEASTKAYADNKVSALVGSSPEALNTLQELATALGNNENFSTTVLGKIGENETKLSGLTTDYTNLSTKVNTNSIDIGNMNNTLAEKASQSDFNNLNIAFNNQASTVLKLNSLTVDLNENDKGIDFSKILSIKYQTNILASGSTISSLASQKKEGIYFVEGENTADSNVTGRALVIVNNDGTTVTQTWYGKTGNIYKRTISTSAMINSANPDSSWSSWKKLNTLYKHSVCVKANTSNYSMYLTIYNKDSTAITTSSSLLSYLQDNEHSSQNNMFSCTGRTTNSNPIIGCGYNSSNGIIAYFIATSGVIDTYTFTTPFSITDLVKEVK